MRARFWSELSALSCRMGMTWLARPSTTCEGVACAAAVAASSATAHAAVRLRLIVLEIVEIGIVQILFFRAARRLLVVDQPVAPLGIGIAQEDIIVERGGLHILD